MSDYTEMLPLGSANTPYRCLTTEHVSTTEFEGRTILQIEPEALTMLAKEAMADIAHLLRPGHLEQLSDILKDPDATDNDRFVARELLKNANIAAGRVLPSCQRTTLECDTTAAADFFCPVARHKLVNKGNSFWLSRKPLPTFPAPKLILT